MQPENIETINYPFYFIFVPETFKLSLERDYFWEVAEMYGEDNERLPCVGDCTNALSFMWVAIKGTAFWTALLLWHQVVWKENKNMIY